MGKGITRIVIQAVLLIHPMTIIISNSLNADAYYATLNQVLVNLNPQL